MFRATRQIWTWEQSGWVAFMTSVGVPRWWSGRLGFVWLPTEVVLSSGTRLLNSFQWGPDG